MQTTRFHPNRAYIILACLSACNGGKNPRHDAKAEDEELPLYESIGVDAVRSGSRLRAQVWVSEEGLRASLNRFYDTELDLECTFLPAFDGTWRCLPWHRYQYHHDGPTSVRSDCSQPTPVLTFTRGPVPELATYLDNGCHQTLSETASIGSGARVFRLGRSFVAEIYYSRGSQLHCLPFGPSSGTYLPDSEIPLSRFVQASPGVEVLDERLGIWQLRGSDGSAIRRAVRDLEHGRICQPQSSEELFVCVPAPPESFFSGSGPDDPDCGDFVIPRHDCGPRPVFWWLHTEAWALTHLTGDTAKEAYQRCFAGISEAPNTVPPLYRLGAAVPPSEFAPLVPHRDENLRVTTDRLELGDEGIVWRAPAKYTDFEDRSYGPCEPAEASDGITRCLPFGSWPLVFSDPECQERLFVSEQAQAPKAFTVSNPDELNERNEAILRVYERGDEYQGSVYHWDYPADAEDSVCTESQPPAASPTVYYEVGAELAPETFVAFTLEILEP